MLLDSRVVSVRKEEIDAVLRCVLVNLFQWVAVRDKKFCRVVMK